MSDSISSLGDETVGKVKDLVTSPTYAEIFP
jgi:hypothetical protein